jgi:hypothetical protein
VRAWVRVQRVLSSPYQICLVVVVLYNIHELDKRVHLKAFSLKTTFRGYMQAQLRENWLLWIHTYLWVSLSTCREYLLWWSLIFWVAW